MKLTLVFVLLMGLMACQPNDTPNGYTFNTSDCVSVDRDVTREDITYMDITAVKTQQTVTKVVTTVDIVCTKRVTHKQIVRK